MYAHHSRPRSPHPRARAGAVSGRQRVLVAVIANLAVFVTWVAESAQSREKLDPPILKVVSDAND